ncbi:hypothetical protein Bhyg_04947 [Pseudolycoriella hygida]|uniref:Putative ionotropic receptor ligand binding domain-containing protein n=1 Tax=Pseudolycoriella hygida TaxID=35572 RepID=A0A9Q0NGJ6_9DIPT|nr:hypothetical protein Bhyg_04947 [Pseudolycoriella hygida]
MSCSTFKEFPESNDNHLVVVINKNGNVSVDQSDLHDFLVNDSGKANTTVSVVRLASPTPSIEAELNEQEELEKEMAKALNLSGEESDGDAKKEEMPKIPNVNVIVEKYYNADEAKILASEILSMFISTVDFFSKIFRKMQNDELFDYTGYYTVVLTEVYRDQYNIISKILNDCWSIYVTNVIIVTSLGSEFNSRSAIYTYFPYTVYHCEMVAPVILNYFMDNTFLYDIDHFPDKIRNMYNCPLTIVTQNVTPFMILYKNENGGNYRTDGIDGKTLRALSQKLNFKPIVKIPRHINGSNVFMEMVC